MKRLAATLAAAMASGPVVSHAKPPKPSIHKQAEAAKKACAPYRAEMRKAERAKGLPTHTLEALGFTESRCDSKAHNKRSGARGLKQITPGGAAAVRRIQRARGETPWFRHGDAWDAGKSIRAAAELVAWGLEVCGGLAEALVAYNTGSCGKPSAFARGVLALAAALRELTGEEPRT